MKKDNMPDSEEEWKKKLTPEQYEILRKKGTERAFTGTHLREKRKGEYKCVACGNVLFSSDTKFDSDGTPGLEGWPSFDKAIPGSVEYVDDNSLGMHRVEVICAKCKSHLGHLFDDPATGTGKHFCINSCSLDFKKKKSKK